MSTCEAHNYRRKWAGTKKTWLLTRTVLTTNTPQINIFKVNVKKSAGNYNANKNNVKENTLLHAPIAACW